MTDFTRRAALVGAGFGLLGASSCDSMFEHVTFNYLLELAVRTRDQLIHAHGVIRVRWRDNQTIPNPGNMIECDVWGEAIPIELGGSRGTVFALLGKPPHDLDYCANLPLRAFESQLSPVTSPLITPAAHLDQIRRLAAFNGKAALPQDLWPAFVMFDDVAVPTSVRQLHQNKLLALDGSIAEVQQVNISVTDKPVTKEIERKLPWLARLAHKQLDGRAGRRYPPPSFANTLTAEWFLRKGY